jgi:hypothetical protein
MSFLWSNSGSGGSFFGGTWSKTQNVWTHIAADRDASNVLRIYQDGAVVASQTVTDTFYNSTSVLEVGDNSGPTASVRFPGRMDEIRITKGVARYAGAFTPPTAAFPNS